MNAKFIEVSAVLDHKIPELLLTIITHLRELDDAKSQRPKGPPTNEMWATSRKIALKMAAGSSSRGGGEGGGNNSGAQGISGGAVSGLGAGGVERGDTLSRLGKKPAKKEIVKFFKKHFSKSVMDDSVSG